jgi:hypothetical protein
MLIIGQDYNVDTRDTRKRFNSYLQNARSSKNINLPGNIHWWLG